MRCVHVQNETLSNTTTTSLLIMYSITTGTYEGYIHDMMMLL